MYTCLQYEAEKQYMHSIIVTMIKERKRKLNGCLTTVATVRWQRLVNHWRAKPWNMCHYSWQRGKKTVQVTSEKEKDSPAACRQSVSADQGPAPTRCLPCPGHQTSSPAGLSCPERRLQHLWNIRGVWMCALNVPWVYKGKFVMRWRAISVKQTMKGHAF